MFPIQSWALKRWLGFCAAVLFPGITLAAAQPGALDFTFNPGRGPNQVSGGDGQAVLLQPNGKFLVSGRFNAVNLKKVAPIVRFNANGSLDTSFNASVIAQPDLTDITFSAAPLALLANGQIIAGGTFDTTDGTHHHLVRLNANGSLDPSFNPKILRDPTDDRPAISQTIIQPDGKILIRGAFDTVNNVARASLARLNPNGSLDTTFNPSPSARPVAFALQTDGKILVARGFFGESLVRLNTNGTIDTTFVSHYIAPDGEHEITSILIQNDGKIIVSGHTGLIPEAFNMSRLNDDGSNDPTFPSSSHFGLSLQRDDKILSYADGFGFQRLNADGSFDSSFHPPLQDGLVIAIAEQSDGELILVGEFFPAPYGIDRIFPNGSRDDSFVVGMGLTNIRSVAVEHAQILPNGKILIGGDFNYVGLLPRNRIAVLNMDGSPDASFDSGNLAVTSSPNNPVSALVVEAGGKVLVGLDNLVVRLNQNGMVDSTFNYHPTSVQVAAVATQGDGKILVGTSDGLIRLKNDGTLDSSFNAGLAGGAVSKILIQPDGKIIIFRRGLMRLSQNGSVDPTFHGLGGEFTLVRGLALQPDGKILVSYEGQPLFGSFLVRLNPDGSGDNSFPALTFPVLSESVPREIAVDQSGIYVVIINDDVRRLTLNGAFDPVFRVRFSPQAEIRRLLVQANGQLILAGNFDKVNNVPRNAIARINGNAPEKAANISTRVRVGNGEAVEIGGFIITGTARKKVLIRALGPSIQSNGTPLPGTLTDPVLELHISSGPLIRVNDDWRAFRPAEILDSGLAPMNEKESAINITLPPDAYTAVLRGKNGETGIALIEIYDLDPDADSKLANISTRGFIGTGDNVLIGGFIFRGSQPERIVIRAIGPSLNAAGIVNPLADPALELRNQSGELVATNDNWKQTQQSELSMSGLAPTNDRESAILATLQTGAYTAIVRGNNGETGVGLVEVYDIN